VSTTKRTLVYSHRIASERLNIAVPLREGRRIARIAIPIDLTKKESKRLSRLLASISQ
jgi:hypothetical protein